MKELLKKLHNALEAEWITPRSAAAILVSKAIHYDSFDQIFRKGHAEMWPDRLFYAVFNEMTEMHNRPERANIPFSVSINY